MKKSVREASRCERVRSVAAPFIAGTFATAYKGSVSSLVIKDFSLERSETGAYRISGKILSLPPGDFEVVLLSAGKTIGRQKVPKGEVALRISEPVLNRVSHLQINLRQKGTHIGSFLLKKNVEKCSFLPVFDIVEQTEGYDPGLLAEAAKGSVGLEKKAEAVSAAILSPRRDWEKLSNEIAQLTRDLFWKYRGGFDRPFSVLAHFAYLCAVNALPESRPRTSHNFFSMLDYLLVNEEDDERMVRLCRIWMKEAEGGESTPEFVLKDYVGTVRSIFTRLPAFDQRFFIKRTCEGILKRAASAILIPTEVVKRLGRCPRREGAQPFNRDGFMQISERWRERFVPAFREFMRRVCDERNAAPFLEGLAQFDYTNIGEDEPGERFTDLVMQEMDSVVRVSIPDLISETLSVSAQFSGKQVAFVRQAVKSILLKCLGDEDTFICKEILRSLTKKQEMTPDKFHIDADVGEEIGKAGDKELTAACLGLLMQEPLAVPEVSGFSEDTWEEKVDPEFMKQLSRFMRIISSDINGFRPLLLRLTCHIRVGGVIIRDNTIFPREISYFLNQGNHTENFLDSYLFLKSLPAYFNEVGATGRLRDLTTEIDASGEDPLLYFLRKQSHCNASSRLVGLVEEMLRFWMTGNPDALESMIPREILDQIPRIKIAPYRKVLKKLLGGMRALSSGGIDFNRLRHADPAKIKTISTGWPAEERDVPKKVAGLVEVYRLLCEKYLVTQTGAVNENVLSAGRNKRPDSTVRNIRRLSAMMKKDREVFLSDEVTEAAESFYYKRHIAFGIPSIMGSYSEKKFNALGDFFRKEARLQFYLEELIIRTRQRQRDSEAMSKIKSGLSLWKRVLDLHGISNPVIDEILSISRIRGLSSSQLRDLASQFRVEISWIVERIQRDYRRPFVDYMKRAEISRILPSYRALDREHEGFTERAADHFIRGVLSSITGLTEVDRFLDELDIVLRDLTEEDVGKEETGKLPLPLRRPSRPFFIDELSSYRAVGLAPWIGAKAKNLAVLGNAGINIPGGFVLPSRMTKKGEIRNALKRGIAGLEKKTRKIFGGDGKPLFVSVRSGSYVSMPGILVSMLYCGMNDRTCRAFLKETGDKWLVYDSFRRFIESYGSTIRGIDVNLFKNCMDREKTKLGRRVKSEFSGEEMEELAWEYKKVFERHGAKFSTDVYDQLEEAAMAVFDSWNRPDALGYRRHMGISDDWGSAVLIMAMISGNRRGSGTVVMFTRDPYTLEKRIYGNAKEQASGDDLVYGKASSMPLSAYQVFGEETSLEEDDEEVYDLHCVLAERIEEAMGGLPQEVETTYERNREGKATVYVLQTKRMEFRRGKVAKFREVCDAVTEIIGRGVGINGGALSGIAIFDTDRKRIETFRRRFPDMPVILVRRETNTSDVGAMPSVDGLLTALGGPTSHAAVQAQKFNLTAVVGCRGLDIKSMDARGGTINSRTIKEGDPISIDGATGLVYKGVCFEIVKEFL